MTQPALADALQISKNGKLRPDDGFLKELHERARFIKRENGKSLYHCAAEDRVGA